jgi:hypothetical protein
MKKNDRRPLTVQALINEQTPGMRGLLAHEILSNQGRRHGPVDGKCEVCGVAAESFTLQDWYRWHCFECVKAAVMAA